MVAWRTLALAIIPLVALFLYATWMMGGFGGVKDTVDDVKDTVGFYLPEIELGKDKLQAKKYPVPKEHQTAIENLVKTIHQMIKSDRTNCFMNYRVKKSGTSGLPDLKEKGTVIALYKNTIEIKTFGGKNKEIELTKKLDDQRLNGFNPCVIAGRTETGKDIAGNFYYSFLDPTSTEVQGDYFKKVNWISLHYKPIYSKYLRKNTVWIDYGLTKEIAGSSQLEDGGWLYKAKDKSICFFPTKQVGRYAKNGLNNNLLGQADSEEQRSVPYLLDAGKLNYCAGNNGAWTSYWWVEFFADGGKKPTPIPSQIRAKCPSGKTCATEDGDCDEKAAPYYYEAKKTPGCMIVASDKERIGRNKCAYGKAEVGSLLERAGRYTNIDSFRTTRDIVTSTLRNNNIPISLKNHPEAKRLLDQLGFKWGAGTYSLVCAPSGFWYECNELIKDRTLKLKNKFGHNQFPSGKEVVIRCVQQGKDLGGKDTYHWELAS